MIDQTQYLHVLQVKFEVGIRDYAMILTVMPPGHLLLCTEKYS